MVVENLKSHTDTLKGYVGCLLKICKEKDLFFFSVEFPDIIDVSGQEAECRLRGAV